MQKPLLSKLLVLALAATCATTAHADAIFKCTVDGTVVFSDAPCAAEPDQVLRASQASGVLYEVDDRAEVLPGQESQSDALVEQLPRLVPAQPPEPGPEEGGAD
jgi:hypothetical protein